MRGKAACTDQTQRADRITPAYAGKSCCKNTRLCGGQDHPRLCGEKERTLQNNRRWKGSPPPMRGKGCLNRVEECRQRITPAYAGKRNKSKRSEVLA